MRIIIKIIITNNKITMKNKLHQNAILEMKAMTLTTINKTRIIITIITKIKIISNSEFN